MLIFWFQSFTYTWFSSKYLLRWPLPRIYQDLLSRVRVEPGVLQICRLIYLLYAEIKRHLHLGMAYLRGVLDSINAQSYDSSRLCFFFVNVIYFMLLYRFYRLALPVCYSNWFPNNLTILNEDLSTRTGWAHQWSSIPDASSIKSNRWSKFCQEGLLCSSAASF